MIPRYSTPAVDELWSDEWTFNQWLEIERQTLAAQRTIGLVPQDATRDLAHWLDRCHVNDDTAGVIRAVERTETHHDVAAFLKFWRDARGQDDAKWLHYGLTSSDLVDTTQAVRFRRMREVFQDRLRLLLGALANLVRTEQPMLGFTHGQPGEPTSIAARAFGWLAEIEGPMQAANQGCRPMQQMKLSGPMGTFAHNPPEVERAVARALGLTPMGPGATQITPRSNLALWGSSCAHLLAAYAKVAHDLRLLNFRGEVRWQRDTGHIGSSAMPHKNNPIEAEQIVGFARMARGFAVMLETAAPLWLERDISNSGPERVAVPDLWHVVLRATDLLADVLNNASLDPVLIELNLMNDANAAWSHRETLCRIADGDNYDFARQMGDEVQVESYDVVGDAKWWMRNYPVGPQ